MNHLFTCTLLTTLLTHTLFATVDPPSTNRTDWTLSGVSNGVPAVATISTTLPAGSTTATIQAALNGAASNTVVLLSPGTYNLTSQLNIQNDGVVLRGSGVDTTVLVGNFAGDYIFLNGLTRRWYDNDNGAVPAAASLVSGYTRGSTSIVMAAPTTDVGVGTYIKVYQGADPALALPNAIQTTALEGGPSTNNMIQMVRVTGVAGATLTITPPLDYTLTASLNPRIFYPVNAASPGHNYLERAGLENLTISNLNSSANSLVRVQNAAQCWVSNVKTVNGGYNHYDLEDDYQCTFQHNVLRGVLAPITSSRCYGMTLGQTDAVKPPHGVHRTLTEGNAFDGLRSGIVVGYGSSANVVAYNFFTNSVKEVPSILSVDISIHSAHPMFNLFEGNIGSKVDADFFHGSGSHNTFFRNALRGRDQTNQVSDLEALAAEYYHRYYFALCNVLGYSGVAADIAALTSPTGVASYEELYPGTLHYNNSFQSFKLGYASTATLNPGDTLTASTMLRHGNWDWVTSAAHYDAGYADHTFSNSLYLATSPFPAGYTFPPIDGPTHTVALTPVQYWYTTYGKWDGGLPPSTGGGTNTGGGVITGKVILLGPINLRSSL